MNQLNSFEKYLLQLHPKMAVAHVIECLVFGESGNVAWNFMGEFSAKDAKDLQRQILQRLNALKTKTNQTA